MPTARQDEQFIDQVVKPATEFSSEFLDKAIDWIESNLEPNDVFSDKELGAWAEANGYIKQQ